jgi:hypothetical protein
MFSFSFFTTPLSSLFVSSPHNPSPSTILSLHSCSFEHTGGGSVCHSLMSMKVFREPGITFSFEISWFLVDGGGVEVKIENVMIEGMKGKKEKKNVLVIQFQKIDFCYFSVNLRAS